MSEKQEQKQTVLLSPDDYRIFIDGIKELLEKSRRTAARSVNALMTATYWEIGRRIVEGGASARIISNASACFTANSHRK